MSPSLRSLINAQNNDCVGGSNAAPLSLRDASTREPQLLVDTDWGAEWLRVQCASKYPDRQEKWDKRAPKFGSVRASSPYVDEFIRLLDVHVGQTVFDMGCGNGAIAVPLAMQGVRVIARDFSTGMLEGLAQEAQEAEVRDLIDIAQLSWEDDWAEYGITPGMAEVAFASRSVITKDLKASLMKLSRVAKNRAVATVSTGYTPKVSPTILSELGIESQPVYDYLYAFNILHQMGYQPEVRYIIHDRRFSFDTDEDALAQFTGSLKYAQLYCSDEEVRAGEALLPRWINEHKEQNELAGQINHHGEVEGAYKIVVPDDVRWAYISWKTGA